MRAAWHHWLAGQFARPHGFVGRLLIGPWLDRISRNMNRLALDALAISGRDSLLEIGFGGGGLLAMARVRTAGKLSGADISPDMVTRARRRFRRDPLVSIVQAGAERLPFDTRSFDAACSLNSLYFWPDLAASLAEIARVLKPRGRLAICFEPPEELRKWPGHVHGFRPVTEAEVEAAMRAAGFESITRREGRGRKPDLFLCLTGRLRARSNAS